MSYAAQAWVNEHAPYAGGVVRAVLKELADAMSKEADICWPGVALLARDSGHSRRAVCYALKTMLEDGVVERANVGGGRGIKAGYRIVKDKSRWTLSRGTLAQMGERAAAARLYDARKLKGAKAAPFQGRERVQRLHSLASKRVQLETEKGARGSITGGSHQLYEPVLTSAEVKGTEAGPIRDPRVGKMIAELRASMDKRARAGV